MPAVFLRVESWNPVPVYTHSPPRVEFVAGVLLVRCYCGYGLQFLWQPYFTLLVYESLSTYQWANVPSSALLIYYWNIMVVERGESWDRHAGHVMKCTQSARQWPLLMTSRCTVWCQTYRRFLCDKWREKKKGVRGWDGRRRTRTGCWS